MDMAIPLSLLADSVPKPLIASCGKLSEKAKCWVAYSDNEAIDLVPACRKNRNASRFVAEADRVRSNRQRIDGWDSSRSHCVSNADWEGAVMMGSARTTRHLPYCTWVMSCCARSQRCC
jgi:hypothetical protein